MAHLSTDPRTPTGVRIDLFADAIENEGDVRRAAHVRQIAADYRARLAGGDVIGALTAFASLDAFQEERAQPVMR